MGARSRPLRPLFITFGWQIAATAVVATASGWLAGAAGVVSAILGGAVALAGGMAFALFMPRRTAPNAWSAVSSMLRAESAKVGVIVILLWLVLSTYKGVVMPSFIGTFILGVVVFSMAVFVRNPMLIDTGKNNVD